MCRHHLFSAYPVPLSFLGWFYLKTEFGSVFALVAVESPAWKHLTKHLKSTSPAVIHMPGALPDISQVALKQNKQPFSRLKTCILLSVQEKVIKAKTLFLLDSVAWQSDVVIKFQLETSVLSALSLPVLSETTRWSSHFPLPISAADAFRPLPTLASVSKVAFHLVFLTIFMFTYLLPYLGLLSCRVNLTVHCPCLKAEWFSESPGW